MLHVLPASNQLYHSLFQPCCVYSPIQPAIPFSLPSMLCVWFSFNKLYLSVSHPCVYGRHSASCTFLYSIHVVCIASIQPAIPFSLPSMLCVQPHSTSHTFVSSTYVVCVVPIQQAVLFSLPSICVWPPFSQLYINLFHPCCVYGPHSNSRAFLSSIHVLCMAHIQPVVLFSPPSMFCALPQFNQPYLPPFHLCSVYGHHSTSLIFLSSIHAVCTDPFNQLYLSLSHPCVYGRHSTSCAFLSSIYVVCMVSIQPAVPFSFPPVLCVWPSFNQLFLSLLHPIFV